MEFYARSYYEAVLATPVPGRMLLNTIIEELEKHLKNEKAAGRPSGPIATHCNLSSRSSGRAN
jgi:hypothetical protein